MNLCEKLQLNPFVSATVDLPLQSCTDDIKTKLAQAAGASNAYFTHDVTGRLVSPLLLTFETDVFNSKFSGIGKYTFNHDGHDYTAVKLNVRQKEGKKTDDNKVYSKNVRRIKPFSGADPTPSGESTMSEWVSLAQDLVDHDTHFEDSDKYYILRNTLIKDALTLVSGLECEDNPQTLITNISLAYGYSQSDDQLLYELRQTLQANLEKPSVLWARLQTISLRIKRQMSDFDIDKERFLQFFQALSSQDFDLMDNHLHLADLRKTKSYPKYGEFMANLQVIERDKLERNKRTVQRNVKSALVTVQEVPQAPTVCAASVSNEKTPAAANVSATSAGLRDSHAPDGHKNQKFGQSNYKPKQENSQDKPKKQFNLDKVECYNCKNKGHRYGQCGIPLSKECLDKIEEQRQKTVARNKQRQTSASN